MSTGGVKHRKDPDLILFPINTESQWAKTVCSCDAEQICPQPGFEHVCAVCCCVWGPALCKRGVHKHCCLKVSAFAVGWCLCCLFPVAPARFPCVFFSVVFACGGGLLGLGEGHQACKSTEIAHTSWRISNLFFVYTVLTFFFGVHHFSPSSPWCTHPGIL